MNDILTGLILGAFLAGLLVVLHIVAQAIKREFYDVGCAADAVKDKDPEMYAMLYRAKQHARRVRREPLPQGSSLKTRLMHMYLKLQPDARYLRLERNLGKLVGGKVTDAYKRAATVRRCQKDLKFLDAPTQPSFRPSNFIAGLVVTLLKFALIPQREGPTEPETEGARAEVKRRLSELIAAYA